jgi:hypothetical protein
MCILVMRFGFTVGWVFPYFRLSGRIAQVTFRGTRNACLTLLSSPCWGMSMRRSTRSWRWDDSRQWIRGIHFARYSNAGMICVRRKVTRFSRRSAFSPVGSATTGKVSLRFP